LQGAQIGAGGLSPPAPLTVTTGPAKPLHIAQFVARFVSDSWVSCCVAYR